MDQANQSFPREIKVTTKKSDDYRVHPVSGARGGPTAQGYVKLDFYIEYVEDPTAITLTFSDPLSQPTETVADEGRFVRESVTAVMMPPEIALSVAKLIEEKANLLLDRSASALPPSGGRPSTS